jgi:hypothetical protein
MKPHWEIIADCLRRELIDYGGLLQLFEAQQHALYAKDASNVLLHGSSIEALAENLAACRARRDEAINAFAAEHGRPTGCTLRSLLPLIAPDARPLLKALIDETNHLLHRVRRASRRNHLLLARAVELHQTTLAPRLTPFLESYAPMKRASGAHPTISLRAAG